MNLFLLTRTSVRFLLSHKGRSVLTVLSIIVGIAAIIATLAIGYGAEEKMRKKIEGLGKNCLEVFSGNWLQEGKTQVSRTKKMVPLTESDIPVIFEQTPEVKKITPIWFVRAIASFGSNNITSEVHCCNEHGAAILSRRLAQGMFFSSVHVAHGMQVVVLGAKAAKELFGMRNPIGQMITIKKIPFRVIGVLEKVKYFLGSQDPNLELFIPITALRRRFRPKGDPLSVHGLIFNVDSFQNASLAENRVRKILRYRHKLEKGDPDDFTIINQFAMAQAARQASNIFVLFLLIVASISLLVGGIGIMNIMLVSVTERTREIGIRMALGATPRVIRIQFLIEALLLCLAGGLIGIGVGLFIPYVACYFTGWFVIVKPFSIVFALFITLLVGLFFGYYPARKASMLNVVDVLAER